MDLSDQGSTAESLEVLGESVDRARTAGHRRQAGWSLSIAGRAHLLRGEDDAAASALAETLALVHDERWMAFLPWPQALQAELEIRRGRLATAATTLDSSWQLACQVGDPCWEGMAARGLGVLAARAGRRAAAATWLQDAHRRCTRWPDRYVWVQAHVLDAVCTSRLPGAHTAGATCWTSPRAPGCGTSWPAPRSTPGRWACRFPSQVPDGAGTSSPRSRRPRRTPRGRGTYRAVDPPTTARRRAPAPGQGNAPLVLPRAGRAGLFPPGAPGSGAP
jgi:hypothetical protein